MIDSYNSPGASRAKYITDNRKYAKIVVIVNSNNEIDEVYNDITLFNKKGSVYRLYELNQPPFEQTRILTDILENRIATFNKIFTENRFILISTFYGMIKKFPTTDVFKTNTLWLQKDMSLSRDALILSLDVLDYINVEIVTDKGEYSIRGDICDIFPSGYENPIRIEFIDDIVDDISFYNIFNHKCIQKVNNIFILPVSEGLYSTEEFMNGIKNYPECCEKAALYGKFAGHHWFSPLLNKMTSIADIVNDDYGVFIFNDAGSIKSLYEKIEEEKSLRKYPLEYNSIFLGRSELDRFMQNGHPQYFNESAENAHLLNSYSHPSKLFIPDTINTYKNLADFINVLKKLISENFSIILSIESKRFFELLIKFIEEYELSFKDVNSCLECDKKVINIYKKKITGGFIAGAHSLIVFSEKDIFGFSKLHNRRKKNAGLQTTLLDLEIGSYVVHVDYGVAIFKGLIHKTIGDIEADFLELQYDNNEILYIPVSAINQIQKYVGSNAVLPRLSSLKSSSWGRIKRRAYHSARQVAADLLKLYGERKKEHGFSFKLDRLLLEKLEKPHIKRRLVGFKRQN